MKHMRFYAQPLAELRPSEFDEFFPDGVEETTVNTKTDWGWDDEAEVVIVAPKDYILTLADHSRLEELLNER